MRICILGYVILMSILGISGAISNVLALDIRVDFQRDPGSPGPNWNVMTSADRFGGLPNLVEFSTGQGTGVSLSPMDVTAYSGADFWPTGDKLWLPDAAASDCFLTNGTMSATFSNLLAQAYRVEVVSSDLVRTPPYLEDITVQGQFADTNVNGTPGVNGHFFNASQDGNLAGNWLIWSNVVPLQGQITVSVSAQNSWGFLNAVRLSTPLPEPSTHVIFVGLGAITLLAYAWRRQKRASS